MDSSSPSVADPTKGDAKGTNSAAGSIQSASDVSEWVLLDKKSDVGLNPIKSSGGGLPLPNIPVWAKWVLGSIVCIAVPLYKRIRRIEDGVTKTAETAIEVIEKTAEVTEKVASNVADSFPGDNSLKEVALKIEDIAELVDKDAEIAEAFIHKVDRIIEEVDTLMEPIIEEEEAMEKEMEKDPNSDQAKAPGGSTDRK
ncbi:uncharacterized protein [Typha angustifolia]